MRSLCDAPVAEQSLEPRVSLAHVMQLARQGQVTHQLRWNAALGSEMAAACMKLAINTAAMIAR